MPPKEEFDVGNGRSTYLPLQPDKRVSRTIDRGEAWVWLDYDENGEIVGVEFLWHHSR